MKKIAVSALVCLFLSCSSGGPDFSKLKEGDIIFQQSESPQSKAISIATGSQYTHMGIIFKEGGNWYVLEAVQPVREITLESWIRKGKGRHYVVKRVKGLELGRDDADLLKIEGLKFLGKSYDRYFEWDNKRIYCSELVWKVYRNAFGIEIGELKKLRDFNVDSGYMKEMLKNRYGSDIPYDEQVISPADMFNSGKLITVAEDVK